MWLDQRPWDTEIATGFQEYSYHMGLDVLKAFLTVVKSWGLGWKTWRDTTLLFGRGAIKQECEHPLVFRKDEAWEMCPW